MFYSKCELLERLFEMESGQTGLSVNGSEQTMSFGSSVSEEILDCLGQVPGLYILRCYLL